MSKVKGKWIDYNPATMEVVGEQLSVKTVGVDAKDAKVSAGDTTPGYLSAKVLGTASKIVATKTNTGANETLVLSLGADVFDKVLNTTDAITEGATKLWYTDVRADARITAQKGSVNGLATLDAGGKVPSAQLPSYVDDVLEYANFAGLPGSGVTGVIYVTLVDNLTYRWSGTAYVEISASLALGETSGTAYRGDRGKTAYDHSQVAHSPANAQKNSDILKSEIEAVLTGAISTHTHTGGSTKKVERLTLVAGDITAKYIDLNQVPLDATAVEVTPVNGCQQAYAIDFTVVSNGSVVKRLNWSTLGMDGLISATDTLIVSYTY